MKKNRIYISVIAFLGSVYLILNLGVGNKKEVREIVSQPEYVTPELESINSKSEPEKQQLDGWPDDYEGAEIKPSGTIPNQASPQNSNQLILESPPSLRAVKPHQPIRIVGDQSYGTYIVP